MATSTNIYSAKVFCNIRNPVFWCYHEILVLAEGRKSKEWDNAPHFLDWFPQGLGLGTFWTQFPRNIDWSFFQSRDSLVLSERHQKLVFWQSVERKPVLSFHCQVENEQEFSECTRESWMQWLTRATIGWLPWSPIGIQSPHRLFSVRLVHSSYRYLGQATIPSLICHTLGPIMETWLFR